MSWRLALNHAVQVFPAFHRGSLGQKEIRDNVESRAKKHNAVGKSVVNHDLCCVICCLLALCSVMCL